MTQRKWVMSVTAILVFSFSICITAGPILSRYICRIINQNPAFHDFLDNYNKISIENLTFPNMIVNSTNLNLTINNAIITGFETLKLVDCSYDNCTNASYSIYVPLLTVEIENYDMQVNIDGVIIYGNGIGSIVIDDFKATVYGNVSEKNCPEFREVLLDLWISRWTVDFEGIMPGTDLQYLFNEFLSMIGPEVFEALEDVINKNYNKLLLTTTNKAISEVMDQLPDKTTTEATTEVTTVTTEATDTITTPEPISHDSLNGDIGLQHTKDSIIDLIAGGVGAAVGVYVGQPLDTIKVKLQTFPKVYNGMTNCFINTYKKDGIRGLYAGTMPALAANIAENSILFAAYGLCQKFVAYIAGVEVKLSPWKLTKSILKEDGLPGLFRGLTSTFAREMPGYFFFFGGYEASRTLLTPPGKTKDDIGPFRTIICGGIAGVTLWVSIFPADVIKSRIQVSGSTEPMFKVMTQILRTEGPRALYNGLTPTVLRSFPATGALFLAYEFTKQNLHALVD